MKIKSRWRDYYDFVEHLYGGGDPRVVYVRDKIIPDRMLNGLEPYEDMLDIPRELARPWVPNRFEERSTGIQHDYRGLAVAGRYFIVELIVRPATTYPRIVPKEVIKEWHLTGDTFGHNAFSQGEKLSSLIALSRFAKAPVFWFNRSEIYGRCPYLGPLGLASILPANNYIRNCRCSSQTRFRILLMQCLVSL